MGCKVKETCRGELGENSGTASTFGASQNILLANLIVGVCVLVFVVHAPVLSVQALAFDDTQYLTRNILVLNPGWWSAGRFLTEVLRPSTVRGYYQPLTMISLMCDYALGGRRNDTLRPFHRTSLALHIANTALLVLLLYRLFAHPWVAAGAGLLFGLHPMTVGPVAWVGERGVVLAAFFSFLCLFLYVQASVKRHRALYFGCLAAYVAAVMSKPTATMLPVCMLIMDYWPLKRFTKRTVLEKTPFFLVGAISAIVTYISKDSAGRVWVPGEVANFHGRAVLIVCYDTAFYLYKIFWPVGLSSHHACPEPFALENPAVLGAVIGACLVFGFLLFSLWWTRAALTGWLFFFVAISPTLGIIAFSRTIASDKHAYLPSVGLLMVLAALPAGLIGKRRSFERTIRGMLIVAVLLLACGESFGTRCYLKHWRTSKLLFERMLRLNPGSALLHFGLGNVLGSEGKVDEALECYMRAIELEPGLGPAYNNMGTVLLSKGRIDEAVPWFQQAIKYEPRISSPYNNLAMILRSQGKLKESIKQSQQALEVKREDPGAHYSLAKTLVLAGHMVEACAHFREALRLAPDYILPMNGLARLLATHPDEKVRRPREAVQLAKQAAGLSKHQNPLILDTLAAAYAASDEFDLAVATAQEGIELLSNIVGDKRADRMHTRLELYKQRKPYYEDPSQQELFREVELSRQREGPDTNALDEGAV